VSVWLPTRNRADCLTNSVESVFRQTYPQIELIVVDDASSDETPALLSQLEKKWNRPGRRFVNIRLDQAVGAPAARNRAIARAKGEFSTGLDDDDEFTDERISFFVQQYNERYSGVCTCLVEQLDGHLLAPQQRRQHIDANRIRFRNYVGNQVFARTDHLREVGGFDESLAGWQDYDLWIRLIDRFGPILKLPNCTYLLDRSRSRARISGSEGAREGYLAFMRKHGAGMTEKQRQMQRVNDLYNRSVRIGVVTFLRLLRISTASRLVSLVLRVRFPEVYLVITRAVLFASKLCRPSIFRTG